MSENQFYFIAAPKNAGRYEVGHNFFVCLQRKPAAFYRWMTKLLLGWKWIDEQ